MEVVEREVNWIFLSRILNENLPQNSFRQATQNKHSFICRILNLYKFSVGYLTGTTLSLFAAIMQLVGVYFMVPEILIVGRGVTGFASPILDSCLVMYIQVNV